MTVITHDLRDTLEGKETEIYQLLCQNLTNAQIAERINMPRPTVQWHLRNIYKKLGVERGSETFDPQLARRRAMLYGGTKIEQVVSYENRSEKFYTVRQIRTAAKKIGCSLEATNDLISFLEMEL